MQNKYYSSIYKSIIITSLVWFNIALTEVEATLQQRWYIVVSTLWNVVLTLFQRRTLTLYQHYITLKIRRWILRHFQRRTNVISTLIQKFDPTLKFGWVRMWALIFGHLSCILNHLQIINSMVLFHQWCLLFSDMKKEIWNCKIMTTKTSFERKL